MWSKELRDYTLIHFGECGSTFLKSQQPRFYAVGFDKKAIFEDSLDKIIPESYREYPIVLFNRAGMGFLTAYKSVKDMVNDGWVMD